MIVRIVIAILLIVSALSVPSHATTLEEAIKALEERCGEKYQPMRDADVQINSFCMNVFNWHCNKKIVQSPEYLRKHPQVTSAQLKRGITSINENIRKSCELLPRRFRRDCIYCQ